MHTRPSEIPMAEWVRDQFGIDDDEELRTLLADPAELMALLDVATASGQDPTSIFRPSVPPIG